MTSVNSNYSLSYYCGRKNLVECIGFVDNKINLFDKRIHVCIRNNLNTVMNVKIIFTTVSEGFDLQIKKETKVFNFKEEAISGTKKTEKIYSLSLGGNASVEYDILHINNPHYKKSNYKEPKLGYSLSLNDSCVLKCILEVKNGAAPGRIGRKLDKLTGEYTYERVSGNLKKEVNLKRFYPFTPKVETANREPEAILQSTEENSIQDNFLLNSLTCEEWIQLAKQTVEELQTVNEPQEGDAGSFLQQVLSVDTTTTLPMDEILENSIPPVSFSLDDGQNCFITDDCTNLDHILFDFS
ncbi:MAG: hypothetical protein VX777_03565 [Chlamydiota bacterium]|nr:hypothetical protein [Chlamydiota bacterium]